MVAETFHDDNVYDLGRDVDFSFIGVTGSSDDLHKLDLNGDGAISYDELIAFSRQYQQTVSSAKFYKKIALASVGGWLRALRSRGDVVVLGKLG